MAEELIGNFACQQHADIGLLMYRLAQQVHAHACADGRDVIGTEDIDKLIKRGDNIVARDDDLGVLAADVVGDFFSVLEVYRVRRHADGKGAYGLVALSSGNGTDE